jgi:glycosyltransferase involved in cell wall biosynthesis
MNGRDIVMMSLQNWGDSLGSNSYNLALEFSKDNRVLYVNRAPDRATQIKGILKKKEYIRTNEWISNINPNLFVLNTQSIMESINFLPQQLFNRFNYLNGQKLAIEIKKALAQLNFKSIILFIDNDFFRGAYLKEFLHPEKFIYYIRDNLRSHEYFKKHGEACETMIARKADLIVANSSFLANLLKPVNTNSHDIGQGCDFSLFSNDTSIKPSDFPENGQPNIGYVGNIVSYRLDLNLIESICQTRKDWNWIFIGPEDESFKHSRLHSLSNVYFLGLKKENELWRYMQHMDICINPQLKNGMTEGNYPRKIDEYLYMGKPVVATRTSFMLGFSEHVHLFDNIQEFEIKIEEALNELTDIKKSLERKNFAASHSWRTCTEKIYSLTKTLNYA